MRDEELLAWSGRGYPPPLEQITARVEGGWWPRLEVGRGWWPLLAKLDATVSDIDPGYMLTGVSVRDGALRFFARGTVEDIRIDDAVWSATLASVHTCEVCGESGVRRCGGDRVTCVLCDQHSAPLDATEIAFSPAGGYPTDAVAGGYRVPPAGANAARAFEEVISRTHLSDLDLARRLHVHVPDVHTLFASGDLAGAERDGRVVYPRWQISRTGRLLPALRRVLRAFPDTYSPSVIRSVILRPTEELCGESPRDWLERGQGIGVVSAFIRTLHYTA